MNYSQFRTSVLFSMRILFWFCLYLISVQITRFTSVLYFNRGKIIVCVNDCWDSRISGLSPVIHTKCANATRAESSNFHRISRGCNSKNATTLVDSYWFVHSWRWNPLNLNIALVYSSPITSQTTSSCSFKPHVFISSQWAGHAW